MADEETTLTTDTTVAPPVTPPVQPPAGLDPQIYCLDDGKTWKTKFYGEQGRRGQIENQASQRTGTFEQQIKDMEAAANATGAETARLQARIAELEGQAGAIPGLQQQVTDLTTQAEKAAKLEVLLQYPTLLSYQVTEQQTPEGGEPVDVVVRPFLNLVNSTTLTGEALDTELRRLASALPGEGPAISPVAAGAAPPPPAPAGDGESPDHWHQQALIWHQRRINGEAGEAGEDPAEMERKCWENKRKAIELAASQA